MTPGSANRGGWKFTLYRLSVSLFLFYLPLSLVSCSDSSAPTDAPHPSPEDTLDILFIGSSFLAYGETDVVSTSIYALGQPIRPLETIPVIW
jgi:hypothetical protein